MADKKKFAAIQTKVCEFQVGVNKPRLLTINLWIQLKQVNARLIPKIIEKHNTKFFHVFFEDSPH